MSVYGLVNFSPHKIKTDFRSLNSHKSFITSFYIISNKIGDTKMIDKKTISISFFILLFTVNLFAGGIIKVKSIPENGGEVSQNIIYIQDGKMRIETSDGGEKTITIIDPKEGKLISIDPAKETYIVLTEEDFNNFMQKINEKKEEILKQFPEEQREAMRQMIDQQMGGMSNQPKTEYNKVGEENFNGYDCEVYNGIKADEQVEKLWITPWENMKLKDEYVTVFKGMEKFFQKMADSMGDFGKMMENEFDTEMFDKGFPVKTIEYEDGEPVSTDIIEEVSEDNLPASLFEAPKNMTRENPFDNM